MEQFAKLNVESILEYLKIKKDLYSLSNDVEDWLYRIINSYKNDEVDGSQVGFFEELYDYLSNKLNIPDHLQKDLVLSACYTYLSIIYTFFAEQYIVDACKLGM